MADSMQINQAMQSLGSLWGAEHAEKDDDGVAQIEKLAKLLRKFRDHEAKEHDGDPNKGLREGTYQLADGRSVYYDNGRETLQDASDLYTVLDENHKTGSPNLENMQARNILGLLQTGSGLGEVHIGTLRELLTKHAPAIAALRRSKDRDGQNPLNVASAGSDSRMMPASKGAAS